MTVLRRSAAGLATLDVAVELRPGDDIATPLLAGFSMTVAELFTD